MHKILLLISIISLIITGCDGGNENNLINGMTPTEAINSFSCSKSADGTTFKRFSISYKSQTGYDIDIDIYFLKDTNVFNYELNVYKRSKSKYELVDSYNKKNTWNNIGTTFQLPGIGKATYLQYNGKPALELTLTDMSLTRYFVNFQRLTRIGFVVQSTKSTGYEKFCNQYPE